MAFMAVFCFFAQLHYENKNIFPLGSVVDLFFAAGESGYYQYAAVVYPVGMAGEDRNFCFSSALIERVVHRGYADEVEDAFVYQLKHQLIVEQGRKSMGFANEEEQEAMRRFVMEEGGGNGKH